MTSVVAPGGLLTLRWPDEPAWNALLRPIAGALERALERLGAPVGDVQLEPGAPGVLVAARTGAIALDPALLAGPHPLDEALAARAEEGRLHALDRWRRAAAAVLEGAAHVTLPEEPDAPPWWRVACAVEAADRAAPELGSMAFELADWLLAPEAGVGDGRRGAWYVRWLRRVGEPRWSEPTDEAWAAFGRWLFGSAAAEAPIPIAAASAEPGSWSAAPLSFRRVRIAAGPAGARVVPNGLGGAPLLVPDGHRETLLLAARAGGDVGVRLDPAGPVGTWALRSGRTGERFGAARGIELTLRADGTGEVTLADAFVGPATEDALSLAAQFGVSGTVLGRWRVAAVDGDAVIVALSDVRPVGVTVHPRGRFGFAIPAGPFLGRAEGMLARVNGTRWRVKRVEEGIEAEGRELGPTIVLRFGEA